MGGGPVSGPPGHTGPPGASAPFPFSALVGLEDLQLALLVAAVDHRVGGVLLRGEKGSAKTTAARGLAALLADGAPFVELPLGATEDRVVGSFDVRAALGTGEYRYRPGLLEAADGGVLYVDEVNLLADHLVDVLLDAAATGVVRVERDGVSETRRASFVLVGSMNPEEGELRPQLLDRFGLSVTVGAPTDPSARAEAVRRRLDFDMDPSTFAARWEAQDRALAGRLALARSRPARLGEALVRDVADMCASCGAEGLRADLVVCRAAAALAAWEGRDEASAEDAARVAPLALAHRRRTPWEPLDPEMLRRPVPPGRSPGAPSGASEGSRTIGPDPGDGEMRGTDRPGSVDGHGSPGGPGGRTSVSAGTPRRLSGDASDEERVEPPTGPRGAPLLEARDAAPLGIGAGRRRRTTVEASRGRVVGSRSPDPGGAGPSRLHGTATVLAAARRRTGQGPLRVEANDLREPVQHRAPSTLVVMVVDASGSMGVRRRLESARAAVLTLLVDAYQRRDRVALVTFRGQGAETVLRPTGSTEIARARLEDLPTGGRTPLAAGLREGLRLAMGRRHAADKPLIVLVSDGRATWADGGADPVAASIAAAEEVREAGVDALVVDCEPADQRLGLAARLARSMGARWLPVADLTADALTDAVRSALA